MSRPQDLYKLQQIDTQLDDAHTRLKQISKELANDRAVILATRSRDIKEKEAQKSRKQLSTDENAVNSQKIKIEQTNATLYSGTVRNPKELQDLQQEVTALKRFLITLEDRQLEAMIQLEETEAALQDAEDKLKQAIQNHESNTQALQVEKSQLENKVIQLDRDRTSMASDLSPEDLDMYQKIRAMKGGVAVVRVVNKSCGACGTTLSAALYQESRSPSKITTCTTCGRILYAG